MLEQVKTSFFPPIGSRQEKALQVLVNHGYEPHKIYFKQGKYPYVRSFLWLEINPIVLEDIKEIYPNSYMGWDDDKEWRRHELVLKE